MNKRNTAANVPQLIFCAETCEYRGGAWCRITTARMLRSGEVKTTINDVSLALGRRLLDRLADRYEITDRAGLYCGRVFCVKGSQHG